MPKVIVYKVKIYDVKSDERVLSRRMATLAGAKAMNGAIVPGTEIEIDSSQLEAGEEWTSRDFNPNATTGFQTQIRS